MVKQTLDITDILQFSKLNITLSAGILLWNQEPSEDVTTTATSTTTATTTAATTTTIKPGDNTFNWAFPNPCPKIYHSRLSVLKKSVYSLCIDDNI